MGEEVGEELGVGEGGELYLDYIAWEKNPCLIKEKKKRKETFKYSSSKCL